jgi:hypothetical protein
MTSIAQASRKLTGVNADAGGARRLDTITGWTWVIIVLTPHALQPGASAVELTLAASVPGTNDETERASQFLKLSHAAAATYELQRADERGSQLKLRPEPVLRWSNPVRGEIYGGVYLWSQDGRPEIAASIFKWYSPFTHMTHEFQSLSLGGIRARRGGAIVWETTHPGVELQPVPEAPPAAAARPARLRQMRDLAGTFAATLVMRDEGPHQLRLLAQPLYRYPEGTADWLDGALFAYVLGTDPEVLLMLESRRDAQGTYRWHYGLARMNFEELHVAHDGQPVWTVPRLLSRDVYSGHEPYVKFQFDEPKSAATNPGAPK